MIGLDRAQRGSRPAVGKDDHRSAARLPLTAGPRLGATALAGCAALGLAGSALAATASAATVSADRSCYVNVNPSVGAPMTITGAGFGVGDSINVSGGTVFATGATDSAGSFSITTAAPELPTIRPASGATTLTVTDDNATTGASTQTSIVVRSANLAVDTKPMSVKNIRRTKVTYSFSGFTPGLHIYGYYARKTVVAKAKFGRAAGPCGTLKQKALLFPGGRPANDQYRVTFESSSRYVKNIFPAVVGTLNILRF